MNYWIIELFLNLHFPKVLPKPIKIRSMFIFFCGDYQFKFIWIFAWTFLNFLARCEYICTEMMNYWIYVFPDRKNRINRIPSMSFVFHFVCRMSILLDMVRKITDVLTVLNWWTTEATWKNTLLLTPVLNDLVVNFVLINVTECSC